MASASPVQTQAPVSASGHCFQWLDSAQAPHDEARGLFVLIRGNAASVESVRDFIEVPPEIEAALCLYAKHHPEDARGIERVLWFRKRVREESDRLVYKQDREQIERDKAAGILTPKSQPTRKGWPAVPVVKRVVRRVYGLCS